MSKNCMIVILLCLFFTVHKVCLSVTYRTYRNGYWWLRDYRPRTNSNHESQVEIIYKLKRNKISWFDQSTWAMLVKFRQEVYLTFLWKLSPQIGTFSRLYFVALLLKGEARGSAHAHLSKCCFVAGTCCIVYESNTIMS